MKSTSPLKAVDWCFQAQFNQRLKLSLRKGRDSDEDTTLVIQEMLASNPGQTHSSIFQSNAIDLQEQGLTCEEENVWLPPRGPANGSAAWLLGLH